MDLPDLTDAGRSSRAARAASGWPPPPSSLAAGPSGACRRRQTWAGTGCDAPACRRVRGARRDVRRPASRRGHRTSRTSLSACSARLTWCSATPALCVAGPIAEMTHEDWRWVIDIDLWGSIHAVEAFLPRLLEQGKGGHIAFTASFAGLVPNAGLGTYGVAKYGVVALAETLAREVKHNGIGVSVLCPMVIETKLVWPTRSEFAARITDWRRRPTSRDRLGRSPAGRHAGRRRRRPPDRPTRFWPTGCTCFRMRRLARRCAAGSSASTAPSTNRPPRVGGIELLTAFGVNCGLSV